jgi:hypothetical protein
VGEAHARHTPGAHHLHRDAPHVLQQNIDKLGSQPNTDTLTGKESKIETVKPLEVEKADEKSDPSEKKKAADDSKQ